MAEVNPDAAENLQRDLIRSIYSLETMPERAPTIDLPGTPGKYHKLLSANHFLILFFLEENTVYVEDILDGRSDWQSLLF